MTVDVAAAGQDSPPPAREVLRRLAWIALAYAGPFSLLLLARRPYDDELRWHARHGFVLFLADLVLAAVAGGACLLVAVAGGGGGLPIVMFVLAVLVLALLVIHGLVAVAALEGTRILLPGVSHFADRF